MVTFPRTLESILVFQLFLCSLSPAFRYPLGRVIGGTVYPGLTLTAGTIWWYVTANAYY
jgi:hypothetical protein